MPLKYKHIFFDLDHTLWDFEANSRSALQSMYTDILKIRLVKFNFNKFFYTYQHVNELWWSQYRMGKVQKEALRTGRFRDTLHRFGIVDEPLTEELASEYIARSPFQTQLFPGAIEVLSWIKNRGHQLHIITNGFEEIQHIKLRESALSPFFQAIITSEQVDARKPDYKIFQHAFDLTQSTAAESLMIGDSLIADIEGARLVGMDQVYFNPKGTAHASSPTYEIRFLDQLAGIIC